MTCSVDAAPGATVKVTDPVVPGAAASVAMSVDATASAGVNGALGVATPLVKVTEPAG